MPWPSLRARWKARDAATGRLVDEDLWAARVKAHDPAACQHGQSVVRPAVACLLLPGRVGPVLPPAELLTCHAHADGRAGGATLACAIWGAHAAAIREHWAGGVVVRPRHGLSACHGDRAHFLHDDAVVAGPIPRTRTASRPRAPRRRRVPCGPPSRLPLMLLLSCLRAPSRVGRAPGSSACRSARRRPLLGSRSRAPRSARD